MSEMVNRVATAIKSALSEGTPGKDPDRMESVARAAIQAMREPTDAMETAGYVEPWACHEIPPVDVWRAMISEALK